MLDGVQAACHLHLGDTEAGRAAAERAAGIVRAGEGPAGRRNLAWEELATMAVQLWHAGEATLAAELLREAIEKLEAGGAAVIAASYRIHLATVLRHAGCTREARRYLPDPGALPPHLRRAMLAEITQIHLAAGCPQQAVTDGRESLDLWQAIDPAPAAEIAAAEGLLAQAYLETGDYRQAETLALRAADVLGPWGHPDAATCLVTIALAQCQSTGTWTGGLVEEAQRLLEDNPLLGRADRARRLDAETCRLERFGRPADARRMWDAVPAQFRVPEACVAVA